MELTREFGQLNQIIKVDLHIHTKASEYKDHRIVENSTKENLDVIFEKLQENGINLFAFADHNRFDKDIFLEAWKTIDSKRYPSILNILPVVEFDVCVDAGKPACHILTIFDVTAESDLDKIVNGIASDELKNENDFYSRSNFENLLRAIGLPVLLIAAQRGALSNPHVGGRSLSDSCDDVIHFLKTGYISALEYQKPKVEGMLLSALVEIKELWMVAMVAGSDCHDWTVYPKHDPADSNRGEESRSFKMKAQPTFLGLLMALTSPSSRFNRSNEPENYIASFSLGGQQYELSPGFNAIIGENGSGKSSLLTILAKDGAATEIHVKKIQKASNIGFSVAGDPKTKYIKQAELIDNMKSKGLFPSECFKEVDCASFKASLKNYSEKLFQAVKDRIVNKSTTKEAEKSSFIFDNKLETYQAFFISIDISSSFAFGDNPWEERKTKLEGIIQSIQNEISETLYGDSQKAKLQKALQEINSVLAFVSGKYLQKKREIWVRNVIQSAAQKYKSSLNRKKSDQEHEVTKYKDRKTDFRDLIIKAITAKNKVRNQTFPSLMVTGGMQVNTKQGFNFITKTKFFGKDDATLKEELFTSVFNSGYRSEADVLKIESDEELTRSINHSGQAGKACKDVYEASVGKFIEDQCSETKVVVDISTGTESGGTLGEQALSFYKYVTNQAVPENVFLIDQPEDNISVPSIVNQLIEYLGNLRDKKQIIFATHNPLLVVNMDVDNVIYLENKNGKICCDSGCLEKQNVLDHVEHNLDGGKDALKRRLNVYEN